MIGSAAIGAPPIRPHSNASPTIPAMPFDASLLTELTSVFEQLRRALEAAPNCSLEPLCRLSLRLFNNPFSMEQHFPLRPLLMRDLSQKTIIKSGRQVGKSVAISTCCVIRCFALNNFKVMILTPFKPQVTNISNTYIKPLIHESPLYSVYVDASSSKAKLFKDFRNGSRIVFSYGYLDVTRVRSYPNDLIVIDEVQDFDINNIPVVRETLTASPWRLEIFTGTPLSIDGTMEQLWQESSMCELVIRCPHCSFFNIPSLEHHLEKMIGPLRDDISEQNPATVCARCRKPISPRHGRWVPAKPENKGRFDGFHVPQIIIPMHYADRARWAELLDKQAGKGPTPRYRFVNEVLGESFDEAASLLTPKDLRQASLLGQNTVENALMRLPVYQATALAIDWGGGGKTGLSLTTVVFAGIMLDGSIEICYGKRFYINDPQRESAEIASLYQAMNPTFVVHDYTSGGNVREAYLREFGVPSSKMVPIYFVGNTTNHIIVPTLASYRNRTFYKLSRARILQFICSAIREGKIRFMANELDENQKLLNDFLSLREERGSTHTGREYYHVVKSKNGCDDFAAATALACSLLWHASGRWPKLIEGSS